MNKLLYCILFTLLFSGSVFANITSDLRNSYNGTYGDINMLSPNINKDYNSFDVNLSECNKSFIDNGVTVTYSSCNFSKGFIKYSELTDTGLVFHLKSKLKSQTNLILSDNLTLLEWTNNSFTLEVPNGTESLSGTFIINSELNYKVKVGKSLQAYVLGFEAAIKAPSLQETSKAYSEFSPVLLDKYFKRRDEYVSSITTNVEDTKALVSEAITNDFQDTYKALTALESDKVLEATTSFNNSKQKLTDELNKGIDNLDTLETKVGLLANSTVLEITQDGVAELKNTDFNSIVPPSNCSSKEIVKNWDGEKWICEPEYYAEGVYSFKDSKIISSPDDTFNIKRAIYNSRGAAQIYFTRPLNQGYIVIASPSNDESGNSVLLKNTKCNIAPSNLASFKIYGTYNESLSDEVICRFFVLSKGYYR